MACLFDCCLQGPPQLGEQHIPLSRDLRGSEPRCAPPPAAPCEPSQPSQAAEAAQPSQPSASTPQKGHDAFDAMFSSQPWYGEVSKVLQGGRSKRIKGEIVQMFDEGRDDPELQWEVLPCSSSAERAQVDAFEVLPLAVRCRIPPSKFDENSYIYGDLKQAGAEAVVLELMIPQDFPMLPPKLRIVSPQVGLTDALKTKMEADGRRPGSTIGKNGGVCAEVLMPGTMAWSPALTLAKVVMLITSQLAVFDNGVKTLSPYFEDTHEGRQKAFGSKGSDFSAFLEKHEGGTKFGRKPKS